MTMRVFIETDSQEGDAETARSAAVAVLKQHGGAEVSIDGESVTLDGLRADRKEEKEALHMIRKGQRLLDKKNRKPGDVVLEVPASDLNATSR